MDVLFVEYTITDNEEKGIKILVPKKVALGTEKDDVITINNEKIIHISKTKYENGATCYLESISVDEIKEKVGNKDVDLNSCVELMAEQADNEVIYIQNNEINQKTKKDFEREFGFIPSYHGEEEYLTMPEIAERIEKKIMFQKDAIKRIVSTIINNAYLENPKNIVLLGSKGVGKSKIIDLLARELNSPYAKIENYDGDSLIQAYLTLFLNEKSEKDFVGPSIVFIDGINKGIEKIGKLDGDILVEIISKIFKKKSPFPISITEQQTILFDPSNINYIVALDLEKDIDMPYTVGIGTNANQDKQKIIDNLREMLVDANCEIIDMNNLTENNLTEILKKSEISPINEYKKILGAQETKLNVSASAYKLIAHSAYKLNKGAKGLSIITDYVMRDEIVEAQYNGYSTVNISQNKVLKKLKSDKKIY